MSNKKVLVLITAALFLTTLVAADTKLPDSGTAVYFGSEAKIEIEPPEDANSVIYDADCLEYPVEADVSGNITFGIRSPQDALCAHKGTVEITAETDTGSEDLGDVVLNIEPKGTSANKGKYLYIRANVKNNGEFKLHNFFISNDVKDGYLNQGGIYIQEVDADQSDTCEAAYDASNGSVEEDFEDVNPEYVGGEYCPDGDGNFPIDIIEKDFGTISTPEFKHPSTGGLWNPFKSMPADSWSPVHDDGSYGLGGQLARGAEPDVQGGNGPFWYVCRSSMDGKVINTASAGSDLLKCDAKTSNADWRDSEVNDWESVAECNDGLDNNNNGKIDIDDPGCDGEDDNTEGGGGAQCANPDPQVANITFDPDSGPNPGPDPIYVKGVLHDADPEGDWHRNNTEGTACKYDSFDTDLDYTGRTAHTFPCFDSTSENEDYYTTGTQPTGWGDKLTYCNSLTSSWPDGHPDNITAAEYFVPEEAIPLGKNKYATESGYKNKFHQHLHDAEQEYAPPCEEVYGQGSTTCDFSSSGGGSLTGYYHSNKTWDYTGLVDLQDGPVTYQGITYDGYNPSIESDNEHDYMDTWVAVNGSANGTYVYSRGDNATTENASFPGGFAPRCDGAQGSAYAWRYVDGDWECSYPTVGQGEITVNFFNTPPVKNEYWAGFQINWTEMRDWNAVFPTPPEGEPLDTDDEDNKPADPVQVRAQCWVGREDNRPDDLSNVVNITREVEYQKHLQMAAELPVRTDGTFYGDRYTCIFGFKQRMKGSYNPQVREQVTVTGTTQSGVEYVNHYFMAGTNEFNPTILTYPGEPLDVTLEELETYASNTGNISQGTDPWKHFPWPESQFSDERRINPEENYCQKYGC